MLSELSLILICIFVSTCICICLAREKCPGDGPSNGALLTETQSQCGTPGHPPMSLAHGQTFILVVGFLILSKESASLLVLPPSPDRLQDPHKKCKLCFPVVTCSPSCHCGSQDADVKSSLLDKNRSGGLLCRRGQKSW